MSLNPKNCMPGEEQYEHFPAPCRTLTGPKRHCQYDYRHTDGELFSCIAPTLEEAHARKQDWLNRKIARESKAISL